MTDIKTTRQQILESDDFVLSEFRKLQYLYGLKREIRFNESRTCTGMGESVAEHIYGMMVAANYFLPLEDVDGAWDQAKIFKMITWHDIEELEVGDMIGYLKTPERIAEEAIAEKDAVAKSPESMQSEMLAVLAEYEDRQTPEARFVKAIDKMDSLLQMYTDRGKAVVTGMNSTLQQHNDNKVPHMKDWPYVYRFKEIITARMVDEGFLITE